jgi:putative ABC transport system substrate-binding protein
LTSPRIRLTIAGMNRRRFLLMATTAFGPSPAVWAQSKAMVRRLGHLGGASTAAITPWLTSLRAALNELDWHEGEHFTIESRSAEGRFERFPALAAELVRRPVDVIIAGTTPAAQSAQRATKTIPIIMTVVSDPVSSGLVASLARPGGNVTGLTLLPGPEIVGKYVELLKTAVPALSRLAVLWNPGLPSHPPLVKQAEIAAHAVQCTLRVLGARDPSEFEGAFASAGRDRADALLVLPDPMFFLQRAQLAKLAETHRLPTLFGLREHVEVGGLMSYAANIHDLYRRAATYVDRIFRGARAGDLPVEQPTTFDLVINARTAKVLGLAIPPSLLARAAQVIE